jgi:hypothetical protein
MLRCFQRTLNLIFGSSPAIVSRGYRTGLAALVLTLQSIPDAAVRWPTLAEQKRFGEMIHEREPDLPYNVDNDTFCFGMADGVNMPVQRSSCDVTAEPWYNGWVHGYFVSNVFLFTPDGCIAWAMARFAHLERIVYLPPP